MNSLQDKAIGALMAAAVGDAIGGATEGRSAEEKKRVGEAIFSAVADRLAQLFATPHFALSLEIREIDAKLSWKKNAIHSRLRGH